MGKLRPGLFVECLHRENLLWCYYSPDFYLFSTLLSYLGQEERVPGTCRDALSQPPHTRAVTCIVGPHLKHTLIRKRVFYEVNTKLFVQLCIIAWLLMSQLGEMIRFHSWWWCSCVFDSLCL